MIEGTTYRFKEEPKIGEQLPEWLAFVREANAACRSADEGILFGIPEVGRWWAGGTVEEYREARIVFVGDGTVRITATSDRAEELLQSVSVKQ